MQDNKTSFLSRESVLRVIFSFIDDLQERSLRRNALDPKFLLLRMRWEIPKEDIETLRIDESHLGIDSLARLDLVAVISRMFNMADSGLDDYLLVQRTIGEWADLILKHLSIRHSKNLVTFASSGTSGTPKFHTHSQAALLSEVEQYLKGPLENWSATGRIVSLVQRHHIFGFLWGVLLPDYLDCEVIDLPPGAVCSTRARVGPEDVVLATPSMWVEMHEKGLEFPDKVIGISSGAAMLESDWRTIETSNCVSLYEIYGSSETAGIGWRGSPDRPFELLGDVYRSDRGPSRKSIVNGDASCPDKIIWESDRTFRLGGRSDNIVQVAGANVCLDTLINKISENPAVSKASIRLENKNLKYFVVPAQGFSPSETLENLHLTIGELSAIERPGSITIGDTLPRNANGKLTDWCVEDKNALDVQSR